MIQWRVWFGNKLNGRWHRKLVLKWGFLFLGLVGVLWWATRNEEAPQQILLVVLMVLTINFGLPAKQGGINVLPIVTLASLLVLGYVPAMRLLAVGLGLAELSRMLWAPFWQPIDWTGGGRGERWAWYGVYWLALAGAGGAYILNGGQAPLETGADIPELALVWLGFGYLFVQVIGGALVWWLFQRNMEVFWQEHGLFLIFTTLLTQPFGYFAGLVAMNLGLPASVIYLLGVAGLAIAVGLSWQRRVVLQQRLTHLSLLNQAGYSLQDTPDLTAMLQRMFEQVEQMVPAERLFIVLREGNGDTPLWHWVAEGKVKKYRGEAYMPDDLTQWVLRNKRVLHLDPKSRRYAGKYGESLPQPMPAFWLGIPLLVTDSLRGAIVLQRLEADHPFSQWSVEVLHVAVRQLCVAVENSRLHSETVRLFNLTDEALARRVEQLQALLNSTKEGVLMVDTQGQVILVNPMAVEQLRTSKEMLQGRPLQSEAVASFLGYTPEALEDILSQLQQGETPTSQMEMYATAYPHSKPPIRRFIERQGVGVLDAQGQIMGWLWVLRDVTEEQELIEWRGDVTRMVVHDLRNPVTTLISTIQRLEGKNSSTANSQHLIMTAKRGCVHMLDMIDSLMDVQQMEAGQLIVEAEAMRLPPLIERVLTHMRPLAEERGIELRFDVSAELPAVWADMVIVRRVLVNLLDNAIKFTPIGGQVMGNVAPEVGQNGEVAGIRCTITDTGPGIPVEAHEYIFDRYTRINQGGAQVQGTGLGLTFCQLAIQAHQGRIWVENAGKGGSQFVFTLPSVPPFDVM